MVVRQSTFTTRTKSKPHELCFFCRDATGKFPDYPDEEEGGSAAIFKKREKPEVS